MTAGARPRRHLPASECLTSVAPASRSSGTADVPANSSRSSSAMSSSSARPRSCSVGLLLAGLRGRALALGLLLGDPRALLGDLRLALTLSCFLAMRR